MQPLNLLSEAEREMLCIEVFDIGKPISLPFELAKNSLIKPALSSEQKRSIESFLSTLYSPSSIEFHLYKDDEYAGYCVFEIQTITYVNRKNEFQRLLRPDCIHLIEDMIKSLNLDFDLVFGLEANIEPQFRGLGYVKYMYALSFNVLKDILSQKIVYVSSSGKKNFGSLDPKVFTALNSLSRDRQTVDQFSSLKEFGYGSIVLLKLTDRVHTKG